MAIGTLYALIIVCAAVAAAAGRRVLAEATTSRPRAATTAALVYAVYMLHTAIIVLAGALRVWSIRMHGWIALGLGAVVASAGVAMFVAGARTFRSLRRISGRQVDRLITTGIYRSTRNPQNLGWFLILLGLAIAGRSWLSILGVGVFLAALHVYLRFVEEPHLLRAYGEAFSAYRRATPRYLGRPRPGASAAAAEPQLTNLADDAPIPTPRHR